MRCVTLVLCRSYDASGCERFRHEAEWSLLRWCCFCAFPLRNTEDAGQRESIWIGKRFCNVVQKRAVQYFQMQLIRMKLLV